MNSYNHIVLIIIQVGKNSTWFHLAVFTVGHLTKMGFWICLLCSSGGHNISFNDSISMKFCAMLPLRKDYDLQFWYHEHYQPFTIHGQLLPFVCCLLTKKFQAIYKLESLTELADEKGMKRKVETARTDLEKATIKASTNVLDIKGRCCFFYLCPTGGKFKISVGFDSAFSKSKSGVSFANIWLDNFKIWSRHSSSYTVDNVL